MLGTIKTVRGFVIKPELVFKYVIFLPGRNLSIQSLQFSAEGRWIKSARYYTTICFVYTNKSCTIAINGCRMCYEYINSVWCAERKFYGHSEDFLLRQCAQRNRYLILDEETAKVQKFRGKCAAFWKSRDVSDRNVNIKEADMCSISEKCRRCHNMSWEASYTLSPDCQELWKTMGNEE